MIFFIAHKQCAVKILPPAPAVSPPQPRASVTLRECLSYLGLCKDGVGTSETSGWSEQETNT